MTDERQRALGALYGLAIGDALGMPTQSLPRPVVVSRYGEILDGFHPGPHDHPIAAGLPAGSVTDDTEQALLVADLLLEGGGRIDGSELARRLLEWEERMRARGSLELLGPSTRRAIDALLAGSDPSEAGRYGTTNGAAMRIAAVGIATPAEDPGALLDRVLEASTLTHNTGTALAAAAAVASAISAGIEGAGVAEAIEVATVAATTASSYGHFVAGADVASRLTWAVQLVDGRNLSETSDLLFRLVGTSVAAQESVPAAFAVLAAAEADAWLAARLGASLGGDCDTIASIAASMAGACQGVDAFPPDSRRLVSDVNHLALEPVADALLALRSRSGSAAGAAGAAGQSAPPAPAGTAGQSAPPAPAGTAGQSAPPAPAGAAGQSAQPVRVASGRNRQAVALPIGPVLVHAGNAVVDLVLRVTRLPERGGDVLASSADWAAGGGVNVMVAARRRGVRVRYAGAHGCGPLGDIVRRALEANGIDILTAPRRQLDTGVVVTLVETTGERTFVTRAGAEATLREDDLAGIAFGPSDGLYVSGYGLAHPPNRQALGGLVRKLPPAVLLVFDPGPLVGELPADALEMMFARADWVSCNAAEAEVVTGSSNPSEAAKLLAARLGRGGSVVRAGADGCEVCQRGGEPVHVAGFIVEAVDTTGAGDANVGSFTAELLKGHSAPAAARVANAAAALAVLQEGPATAPTAGELDAFLASRSAGA